MIRPYRDEQELLFLACYFFSLLFYEILPSVGSFSSSGEASCREMVCLVHRRLSISKQADRKNVKMYKKNNEQCIFFKNVDIIS